MSDEVGSSAGSVQALTGVSTALRGAVASSPGSVPAVTAISYGSSPYAGSVQSVPAIVAYNDGYSLHAASSALVPAITADSVGVDGEAGSSGCVLEQNIALGGSLTRSAASVPATSAVSVGLSGDTGGSGAPLPLVRASASAVTAGSGASAATLPQVLAFSAALAGSAGVSAATLARIVLAAQGVSGTVGTSTLLLPLVSAHSAGVEPATGASVLVTLPAIIAHGMAARAPGASTTAVALHTENFALTEFSNFNFNSFARFHGVEIAASAAGIFAMVGDTDDGAIIDAMIRVGVADYGSEYAKRIDRMYVGYRASGAMVLTVTAGGASFEYPLAATAGHEAGNRVQIGKALQARYWQFELRNTAGADFSVDEVHVVPHVLARRTRA